MEFFTPDSEGGAGNEPDRGRPGADGGDAACAAAACPGREAFPGGAWGSEWWSTCPPVPPRSGDPRPEKRGNKRIARRGPADSPGSPWAIIGARPRVGTTTSTRPSHGWRTSGRVFVGPAQGTRHGRSLSIFRLQTLGPIILVSRNTRKMVHHPGRRATIALPPEKPAQEMTRTSYPLNFGRRFQFPGGL